MSRPVLYMLPGLLCDEAVFAAQIAALSDVCDVRVPSFRGLDSFDAMAQAVLADAPPRFSVAGFSMGGRVAFRLASIAMDRIERFCAFDTGVIPASEAELPKRQALVDIANRDGMAALAAAWLPPMLHETRRNDIAFTAPLTEMVMRFSPLDHEKQIRALINRPDMRPVLAQIKCPTLIACGRQDGFSPPADHEAIAAAISGARLEIVENSGHFLPVEQPDALNKALLQWLAIPQA
ncbi:MAG: alpha/beta hydrolase [Beijerinckiaceae bacterium]|nr:alpha/beta hydrolase [Beijerinckiaceae bacterium]